MLSPRVTEYLESIHGTQAGQLICELGAKVLKDDYPIQVLNDQDTVEGMILVLDAVKAKLAAHLATHPFKH